MSASALPFDVSLREYAIKELLLAIKEGKIKSKRILEQVKREVQKKYHLKSFISNSELLAYANQFDLTEKELQLLQKKPTRSLSGVSIVAVMTPPEYSCPFDCTYCPSAENAPKSYTGREPSTLRGIQYNYNSYQIVKARVEQLQAIGHPVNKIHLVIQGGTFLCRPKWQQLQIVKGCLDAIHGRIPRPVTLAESIELCEKSHRRVTGITFETRPDYCRPQDIDNLLRYGGTWVEIGVQTLSDTIYQRVKRGHTVEDVIIATRRLKDAGFKVTYHMMPNLYSTPEEDIGYFQKLFHDNNFRPDALKIYPTLVLEGTQLYEEWKRGIYTPYSLDDLIATIGEIKSFLPPYVRIQRIQRDIPAYLINNDIKKGNLRELVHNWMEEHEKVCRCIRCREIGRKPWHRQVLEDDMIFDYLDLVVRQYQASKGTEYFISVEDLEKDVLFGFVRLRLPSTEAERSEIASVPTAIVRELHVYGQEIPVGETPKAARQWQHRGFGKVLMQMAEHLSLQNNRSRILVISGIGVREYYRKLGYKKLGPYMAKDLHESEEIELKWQKKPRFLTDHLK